MPKFKWERFWRGWARRCSSDLEVNRSSSPRNRERLVNKVRIADLVFIPRRKSGQKPGCLVCELRERHCETRVLISVEAAQHHAITSWVVCEKFGGQVGGVLGLREGVLSMTLMITMTTSVWLTQALVGWSARPKNRAHSLIGVENVCRSVCAVKGSCRENIGLSCTRKDIPFPNTRTIGLSFLTCKSTKRPSSHLPRKM